MQIEAKSVEKGEGRVEPAKKSRERFLGREDLCTDREEVDFRGCVHEVETFSFRNSDRYGQCVSLCAWVSSRKARYPEKHKEVS